MFHKYIVYKDNNKKAVCFDKWETQIGSTTSIISSRWGTPSFVVKKVNLNCDISLSLFCEYVSRKGVERRGNFYIKIIGWHSTRAIENFIIKMSNHFNINTSTMLAYEVNCKSSCCYEKYTLLELSEFAVRRNKFCTDGYHLSKIYKMMTEAIYEFSSQAFSNEQINIDSTLYDDGLYSCVTYCDADIKFIKINKSCRISTESKQFELLDFSAYRLIYTAITTSNDMAISVFNYSCKLFHEKLNKVKFSDMASSDLFLLNFVVSILSLKGNKSDDIFYIQSLARELLSTPIRELLKKGITATCSGLRCQFRKCECKYSSIKNPFHLFHTHKTFGQLSADILEYSPMDDSKLESIKQALPKFIDHKEILHSESLFILFIFTCIAVSKCRFSVYYNNRVYNNSLPLIVNFSKKSSINNCMKFISLLEKFNNDVIKNTKATNLSKHIKKNECLTIVDTMENGRFSILQMANTYTQLSESCLEAITKFGCFDTDRSARINTLIISENNKISEFFKKRPRALRNKLQKFIITDHYHSEDSTEININIIEDFILSIDKSLTANKISIDLKDIDFKYNILRATNKIYDYHGLADLYDLKFKINTLTMSIMFSCFLTFFEKKKENISFGEEEANISCFILDIILFEIKESLRKNGDLIFDFYEKILKKVLLGKFRPVYITKREIQRAIGVNSRNKYVDSAIQNLITNKKIVQIDICLKKRKGRPCGPIYYVPENNIRNKRRLAFSPKMLKENALG